MPLHDWTRVDPSSYHSFVLGWFGGLRGQLNTGLLPSGYSACIAQVDEPATGWPRYRHLFVRHEVGHRPVALIKIASPGNKDSVASVRDFVEKAASAVRAGVHLVIADPFPPGRYDPAGLVGAIAHELSGGESAVEVPAGEPLGFAAVEAGEQVGFWLEPRAVGAELPTLPLFLSAGVHVPLPLGPSYEQSWVGTPRIHRDILEARP